MSERFTVLAGDMREHLAALAPCSIDSCVTDPPYELGFMGRAWDSSGVAFDPATWAAVLRVLKPGAHLLAFGGSRTWHRIAVAIEDAGFEIRDTIAWMYGSGFPKSLDVSKAIDKAAGAEREVVGPSTTVNQRSRPSTIAMANRPTHESFGAHVPITAPATDAARRWSGWGTALKPAFEPIIVARKPLVGTVAHNVVAHGTGAINVDGCRIAGPKPDTTRGASAKASSMAGPLGAQGRIVDDGLGRWPANVILDEEAAAALDAQTGVLTSGGLNRGEMNSGCLAGIADTGPTPKAGTASLRGHTDSGGASRFFRVVKEDARSASDGEAALAGSRMYYTAKADASERDAGLHDLPSTSAADLVGREADSAGMANPRAGAGRTSSGRKTETITVEATWGSEVRRAVLLVDTGASPPRVISASGTLSNSATEWSMCLFGSEHMAPSLRATTSITSTRTNSTTGSKISRWFRDWNTSESTEDACERHLDGTSHAGSAEGFSLSLTSMRDETASLPGAELVASPTLWRISGDGKQTLDRGRRNIHNTVKPIDLMRYLVRLVTPPGGLVLDPFTGSGTTGVAAMLEGFRFVGTELETPHAVISHERIDRWAQVQLSPEATGKTAAKAVVDGWDFNQADLFTPAE